MAYIKPSVLVYQELQNAGGVANVTPDLGVAIVGPLFNVVTVDPTDSDNLTLTQGAQTSDFASDGDLRVDLKSTFPGQKVLKSSLKIWGTDAFVKTTEFSVDVAADQTITANGFDGDALRSQFNFQYDPVAGSYASTFTPSGAKPDAQLPDASGAHIKVGDKVIVSYVSPDSVTGVSYSAVDGADTVTVTSAAHGLVVGDKVVVSNATLVGLDGLQTITAVTANSFTFVDSSVVADVAGTLDYNKSVTHVTTVSDLVKGQLTQSALAYAATDGVDTVVVTQNAHSLSIGDKITVTNATLTGLNTTQTITETTANTFTFVSSSVVANVVGTLDYQIKKASITDTTGFSISSPIETFATPGAVTATVEVFRFYDVIELPQSVSVGTGPVITTTQVDATTADSGYITLQWVPNGFTAYKTITITGADENSYDVVSGKFHLSYRAVRQDKYSTILTLNSADEALSVLGPVSSDNPLALGVSLALANTTTSVMAVSLQADVDANENISYNWTSALELLENQRTAYALVPLTQESSVLAQFKTHVEQMSTPVNAAWRVAIVNSEVPSVKYLVGNPDLTLTTGRAVHVGTGPVTVYMRDTATAGGPDFITAGVTPGDMIVITASSDPDAIGTYTVEEIPNSKNLKLEGFSTNSANITDGATITYYIERSLTRRQRAEAVAAMSSTLKSNRVWHIQPDIIGVNVGGVVEYLPGYYLCAAMGGMTAGFPVQQGFTNISVAGIEDLQNSNFYFTKEDLNVMAEAGTCLYVQETQGGIPFCRHELTTDMTVLEYREIVKVKNWDFLSFYFYDKMKGFIGTWNITPDTLSNMKQVMIASCELLLSQKLPRIGAPLLSYEEPTVVQNEVNKDMVDIRLPISTVTPNNYTNIYLVI